MISVLCKIQALKEQSESHNKRVVETLDAENNEQVLVWVVPSVISIERIVSKQHNADFRKKHLQFQYGVGEKKHVHK